MKLGMRHDLLVPELAKVEDIFLNIFDPLIINHP